MTGSLVAMKTNKNQKNEEFHNKKKTTFPSKGLFSKYEYSKTHWYKYYFWYPDACSSCILCIFRKLLPPPWLVHVGQPLHQGASEDPAIGAGVFLEAFSQFFLRGKKTCHIF